MCTFTDLICVVLHVRRVTHERVCAQERVQCIQSVRMCAGAFVGGWVRVTGRGESGLAPVNVAVCVLGGG